MARTKEIRLRVFTVQQQATVMKAPENIVTALVRRLENSIAKDRMIKRSQADDDQEYDVLAFATEDKGTVFGAMVRLELDAPAREVPEDFLKKKNFTIAELPYDPAKKNIYKNHYYFCLSQDYLASNIPGNVTIASFQTYINAFLQSAACPYSMAPLCRAAPDFKLADIGEIEFSDDFHLHHDTDTAVATEKTDSKLLDLGLSQIKNLLSDALDLGEEELRQVVSAKLLLKIRKPRHMTEEDYQRKYSALFKPVADITSIKCRSKQGQLIKADEILVTRKVNIELTEKGFLVDEMLRQEMIALLNEQIQSEHESS